MTGYIGGDTLYAIANAHPEYEITCSVRSSEKGAPVAAQYPKIRLVYGDLDSTELLEQEAKNSDIVLRQHSFPPSPCPYSIPKHTDTCLPDTAHADHVAAANAIINGLASHTASSPGYLIHTSGTGILMTDDMESKTFGEASSKVYNDWDAVSEITQIRDAAPHRNVDKIVLEAGTTQADKIKTAIVCPPTIYGPGRGPGNQVSQQIPSLAAATLQNGRGFQVGAGKTWWNNVHVHDLSDVYLKLVEAAAAGGGKVTWGADGYYLAENGEHVWGDIGKKVGAYARDKGYIESDEIISLEPEEVMESFETGKAPWKWNIAGRAYFTWGLNSRGSAVRARKVLGWEPKGESIDDTIPGCVEVEAKRLGLKVGHAAKAAG